MVQIFSNINVDWMGKRKLFIFISVFVLLAGLLSAVGRELFGSSAFNLGVDFRGGTVVTVKFKEKPSVDELRAALQAQGISDAVIQESIDKADEVLIKVPTLGRRDECPNVDEAGRCFVKKALDTFGKEAEANLSLKQDEQAKYKIVGTEVVGPVAGAQLRNQAVSATLLGLVGILFYIAYRYDWTYAAGAVIAVFHDVLVTIAFFSIFQWEINLTVVAAFLTLVGYSVNDSIVIFDRIRENMTLHRGESIYKLTNDSINQTMSRTVVTNGLVLLSVLALVLFGGEVLRSFSLALLVGSITGTYSTIAIASPIAIWWQSIIGVAEMEQPERETSKLATASRRSTVRRFVAK
ncbi:MAG: protein translocase subunit SecF [Acidobacteria bacterium]|nr:MAG: protein translocase subunit SecF [Acidobacteriota bacterium]